MMDFSAIFTHSEASTDPEVYPFDIPDLWRPSHLAPDLSLESPLFPIALLQETTKQIYKAPTRSKATAENSLFPFPADFNAPSGAWPGYEQPSRESLSSSPIEEDGDTFSLNTNEKLWADPDACKPPEKPRFQTWDSFLVAGANEPVNPYFSEAGPRVFDAVLSEYVDRREDVGDVIRSDVFCICLLHLGMGRSSVLFTYDRRKGEFRPVRKHLRISGCTAGTVESIVQSFASTGNKIKILQSFIDDVYAGFNAVSPSVIALADCITSILESLQQRLSIPPTTIHSLLHLHSLIREPALIISTYHSIISATRSARNDSELLTQLFAVVQQEQHRSGWLKPLLMETLARVSRPWLGFVEEWIGLDRPIGGEGIAEEGLAERGVFVRVEEERLVDERGVEVVRRSFIFDKRRVPSFTSADSAESVFESGKSLRFLQKFHPNHPLSKPGAVEGIVAPKLEWKFSWEDLDKWGILQIPRCEKLLTQHSIQTQAKNYERKLQSAIERYAANGFIALDSGVVHHDRQEKFEEFPTFGKSVEQLGAMIHHSASAMDQALPPLESSHNDLLRRLVLSISRRSFSQTNDEKDHLTTFAPPISITPMLSFSYIFSVQAKLINTACLRMFFSEHKIRSHLTLLRRFQLFGNGVFASRLSHALFDDELDATERRAGGYRSGGTMGLKLGSRDSWPPASSELRLALMGVLTESFSESIGGREEAPHHRGGIYAAGKEGELPGGLSFAVRDMTQEELERCMDPNCIEALDFLKLQYNPPSPLEAIITPTALYRYDRVFKLLLRLLRMLFVVNKLFRDATSRVSCWAGFDPVAQKFRIEAHHFVSTVCGYMFETGVGSTWKKFDEKLADIERKLCGGEEGLEGEGLERLRSYHESILDRIMFATLTRKRQAPVMKLVEDIFVAVLGFAKYSHERASGRKGGTMGTMELAELYKVFRRRIGIFISVCRGLSEKRGYGDGRRDLEGRRAVDAIFGTGYKEEGNLLGILLVRLEMTGYYSESVGVGVGGVKGK